MSIDRPLFIVNPASGGGRTGRLFDEARRPIGHVVGDFDVAFTARAGHAADLARQAALEGRTRIVAVGGDGTFSEIASGVLASGAPAAVGLVHQGTGGDFRRSLGMEHRLDRYLEAIARNTPRLIDAGRIEHADRDGRPDGRFFVNVASLGMGGLVARYVDEGPRALGPTLTYLGASLRSLAEGTVGRLTCEFVADGERRIEHVDTRILAVCNGRYFGGGMNLAPNAELDDGLFDVVLLRGGARLPVLSALAAVYRGRHLTHTAVQTWRVSELNVRLDDEREADRFLVEADGEWIGRLPVSIRVLPKALRVLV